MNTKTLVAGQTVTLYGCGYLKGTLVSLTCDGIEVSTDDGLMHFNNDGKETEASRYRRVGSPDYGYPEQGPWELVDQTWTRAH